MAKPRYNFDRPVHEVYRRRYHRLRRLMVLVLFVFALVAGVLAYNWYRLQHAGEASRVGPTYQQQIAGPQLFRSSYFQFSDTSKWVYAPNDSTATKLTYLLYESGLPAHSMTVYVNQTPLQYDLAVTRVLPVQIDNKNSFNVGDVSAPCSTLYKPTDGKNIRLVSLSGTSMLCVPDSPQYLVAVGQTGGDYNLSLTRTSGEVANYIIIYHNLSVNPDPAPFLRIMKTFKAL